MRLECNFRVSQKKLLFYLFTSFTGSSRAPPQLARWGCCPVICTFVDWSWNQDILGVPGIPLTSRFPVDWNSATEAPSDAPISRSLASSRSLAALRRLPEFSPGQRDRTRSQCLERNVHTTLWSNSCKWNRALPCHRPSNSSWDPSSVSKIPPLCLLRLCLEPSGSSSPSLPEE